MWRLGFRRCMNVVTVGGMCGMNGNSVLSFFRLFYVVFEFYERVMGLVLVAGYFVLSL